jgi:hypothetical protein
MADFCPPQPAVVPPQDRRQLIGGCVKSSLAHLRWRPQLLTGLFRDLLTKHFSTPDNIEDPNLRSAIWQEGQANGILIESVYRWRGDVVEKRPALLVKRNAMNNMRIAINDLHSTDSQGFQHFSTLWVGSHTVFCIGGTGAAAEILGTEVQRELTEFGPAIRSDLVLSKYQVMEVGEIAIVEEATQSFMVPVTIGWAYEESWQLRPDALKLTGFNLQINIHDC